MGSIVYTIGNSLYLNITNRCTNECGFCIRNVSPKFNQKDNLWLEHEPTAEELIAAIGDPTRYDQIVFCGYGEPLIRLDVVKAVATALKSKHPTSNIKTNGNDQITKELLELVARTPKLVDEAMEMLAFSEALSAIWQMISQANGYIEKQAPWALAKKGETGQLAAVMSTLVQVIKTVAELIVPFMPETAAQILAQLNLGGEKVAKGSPLFPRIQKSSQP